MIGLQIVSYKEVYSSNKLYKILAEIRQSVINLKCSRVFTVSKFIGTCETYYRGIKRLPQKPRDEHRMVQKCWIYFFSLQ